MAYNIIELTDLLIGCFYTEINMEITYANNKIERQCNQQAEMKKLFSNDKSLVEGLQTLMTLLAEMDNIDVFGKDGMLKGYNLERVIGSKNGAYSIRIIPKMRKSHWRMFLIPTDDGIEIEIIDINKHDYKNK